MYFNFQNFKKTYGDEFMETPIADLIYHKVTKTTTGHLVWYLEQLFKFYENLH